jgi:hypothetical protein
MGAYLWDMGCELLQGYWYSKPLPRNAVIKWIKNRDAQPSLNAISAIAPVQAPRYLGANRK